MVTIKLMMYRGLWRYRLADAAASYALVGNFASAERALTDALERMESCFDGDNPGMEVEPGVWLDPADFPSDTP